MARASHHESRRVAAVGLLTVSDSRTVASDGSGSAARRLIEGAGHTVAEYRVVPDDAAGVRGTVSDWLSGAVCDAVVTTGGTGVSARDRTFEALSGLIDRRLDGFGELFRMLSFEQVGARGMLSRAVGGIASGKPLFALPGSTAAVELALERLVLPVLGHLLDELERDD